MRCIYLPMTHYLGTYQQKNHGLDEPGCYLSEPGMGVTSILGSEHEQPH